MSKERTRAYRRGQRDRHIEKRLGYVKRWSDGREWLSSWWYKHKGVLDKHNMTCDCGTHKVMAAEAKREKRKRENAKRGKKESEY